MGRIMDPIMDPIMDRILDSIISPVTNLIMALTLFRLRCLLRSDISCRFNPFYSLQRLPPFFSQSVFLILAPGLIWNCHLQTS